MLVRVADEAFVLALVPVVVEVVSEQAAADAVIAPPFFVWHYSAGGWERDCVLEPCVHLGLLDWRIDN